MAWGWGATVSPQLQRTSSAMWTRWTQVGAKPASVCSVRILNGLFSHFSSKLQPETLTVNNSLKNKMTIEKLPKPQALIIDSSLHSLCKYNFIYGHRILNFALCLFYSSGLFCNAFTMDYLCQLLVGVLGHFFS